MPQRHPIGAHSRLFTFAKLDKRRKEAWFMQRVRQHLAEHVGSPSFVQRLLIERAAVLMLRLALFDQKVVDNEPIPLHSDQWIVAWQNALVRTLAALGVKGTPGAAPANEVASYLAQARHTEVPPVETLPRNRGRRPKDPMLRGPA
jgi:hypothetical protein